MTDTFLGIIHKAFTILCTTRTSGLFRNNILETCIFQLGYIKLDIYFQVSLVTDIYILEMLNRKKKNISSVSMVICVWLYCINHN